MGKKPRKGFRRSRKEWEESVAGHIGRFIDRVKIDDVVTLGAGVGGALVEMKYKGSGLRGFIVGMIAYKLATSPNLVASTAGLGVLATIGLTSLWSLPMIEEIRETSPGLASSIEKYLSESKEEPPVNTLDYEIWKEQRP